MYSKLIFITNHRTQKLCFLLFLFSLNLFSQESIVTVGGDISEMEGSVSYTIGQTFFNSFSNANNSVSEGVQQPFEISTLTINEVDVKGVFRIFPIPTSDYLTLKISNYNVANLTYEVINLQGKVLLNNIITSNETTININNLEQSIYFLNIKENNKLLESTKILKY